MSLRVVQFLAVLFTALALVSSGAHLFELPSKKVGHLVHPRYIG